MIIFDTETTGLIKNSALPLKQQPEIIEIYALKLDNKTLEPIGEFHSLFWVKEVPAEVVGITGITTEMLKDAPRFASKVDDLVDFFLGERYLFGHNLAFDRDMLAMELRRLGMTCQFPWPPVHRCTVEDTEGVEGFRQSLTALHEKLFGEKFDSAHRAKSDVIATAKCVRELIKRGDIKL